MFIFSNILGNLFKKKVLVPKFGRQKPEEMAWILEIDDNYTSKISKVNIHTAVVNVTYWTIFFSNYFMYLAYNGCTVVV